METKAIEYLKKLLLKERRWRLEEVEEMGGDEVDEGCDMFKYEIEQELKKILSA